MTIAAQSVAQRQKLEAEEFLRRVQREHPDLVRYGYGERPTRPRCKSPFLPDRRKTCRRLPRDRRKFDRTGGARRIEVAGLRWKRRVAPQGFSEALRAVEQVGLEHTECITRIRKSIQPYKERDRIYGIPDF
jgi:hypothetical protein